MVALIEHLIDPLNTMKKISSLLTKDGFCFIMTPNIAKYTQRLKLLSGRFPSTESIEEGLITYGGQPVTLHEEGHLHYFTFKSLSRMLTERCGFDKISIIPLPDG